MKRIPLKWLGVATAAAMLVAGCTAQPQNANRMNQSNVFTTTGDDDQCAAALGNTVTTGGFWGMGGAGRNAAANGVIIGNVALVALPEQTAGPAATGSGIVGAGATGRIRSNAIAPGNPAAPDGSTVGTPGTIDTVPNKTGTTVGNTGLAGVPGVDTDGDGHIAAGGAGTIPGGAAADAGGAATGAGAANAGGTAAGAGAADGAGRATGEGIGPAIRRQTAAGTGTTTAVERIRTACPRVADIRVVSDESDRNRLAEITAAVRTGRPITEFMTDLVAISQRATSAGPGMNARPGVNGGNRTNRTNRTNGTNAPATQGTGRAEMRTGGPGPSPGQGFGRTR